MGFFGSLLLIAFLIVGLIIGVFANAHGIITVEVVQKIFRLIGNGMTGLVNKLKKHNKTDERES